MNEIETIRYLDVPQMDEGNPGFPLNKILPMKKWSDLYKKGRSHPGDHIPKSRAMRKYLLTMLKGWKPVMIDLVWADRNHAFRAADFRAVESASRNVNEPQKETFGPDGIFGIDSYMFETLDRSTAEFFMNQLAWKILAFHQQKHVYPTDLKDLEPDMNAQLKKVSVIYSLQPDGFILKTVATTGSKGAPAYKIVFPSIVARGPFSDRETISKFLAGKIDINGNEIKAKQ